MLTTCTEMADDEQFLLDIYEGCEDELLLDDYIADDELDDLLLEESSYDFKESKEEEIEEVEKEIDENEPTGSVNRPVRSVSISDDPIEDKPRSPKIIKLTKPPGSNDAVIPSLSAFISNRDIDSSIKNKKRKVTYIDTSINTSTTTTEPSLLLDINNDNSGMNDDNNNEEPVNSALITKPKKPINSALISKKQTTKPSVNKPSVNKLSVNEPLVNKPSIRQLPMKSIKQSADPPTDVSNQLPFANFNSTNSVDFSNNVFRSSAQVTTVNGSLFKTKSGLLTTPTTVSFATTPITISEAMPNIYDASVSLATPNKPTELPPLFMRKKVEFNGAHGFSLSHLHDKKQLPSALAVKQASKFTLHHLK